MKYPKKADLDKALKTLEEFLRGPAKAELVEGEYPMYLWRLNTKAGELRVHPSFEPKRLHCINCRFWDVDAAVKHFNVPKEHQWGHRLNHYSGKWNFMSSLHTPAELVEFFKDEVTPLLP